MADYSNDQFYNWKSYESISPTSRTSRDNPEFLWPSNDRKLTNVSVNRDGTGGPRTQRVQRGYMRMLSEALGRTSTNPAIRNLGSHRLFFQFNPDTITRSVAARNDIQYWMNMDPIQLTQPIPGDQNFAFELMFNREAEVASGTVKNINNFLSAGDAGRRFLESALTPMQNPSQVGVLADLYQFDRIIGQGISRDVIETYIKNAQLIRDKEIEKQKKTNDEEDTEEELQPLSDEDRRLITQNISINVGNSAFLVANPIRIVFSSLFMVEGYVTQTQVVFNKFNQDMVPTQCVVNLSMQALYIGAAKKDTFLTLNGPKMDDISEEQAEKTEEEKKQQVFIKDFADKGFKNVNRISSYPSVQGAYDLLDTGGARKLYFSVQPSDDLKNVIKQSQVQTLTANAKWTVKYVTNTGTKPANTHDYGKTWEATSSVELNLNKIDDVYTLSFDRPTMELGKLVDTSDTSQYSMDVVISFTYLALNGTSYESIQKIKWSTTVRYKPPSTQTGTRQTAFTNFYTLSNG